jgi:sugar lactone lactonase YvrE
VVDGLTISNGPALDESQGRLYLADTALGVVDVFDLDPATGDLTDRRRFLDLGDAQVWPDGMTVDDEGMLWLALGRAAAVHRYGLDGAFEGVVELPTANPTSVAFGGVDGGDLYITTSWFELVPDRAPLAPVCGRPARPGPRPRPGPATTRER